MATELFPYTVNFVNNFFRVFQPTNNNLLVECPLAQDFMITDPGNNNYFYLGTPGNKILLDYTLCTNLTNTTRQILMDNIVGLVQAIVTVNQGTNPWVVTTFSPASTDIVGASRTTTGTMVTIPAGRTFKGQVSLSGSISVAGNCQPTISVSGGAGVAPIGVIHQINVAGLALSVACNANTMGNVYISGGAAGATVTFTQGASGNSSGQIVGKLL